MEKISQIVRGNARLNSVDLKSASSVRPGAATFGRSVGASNGVVAQAGGDESTTTASRAASIQSQMADHRRSSSDRVIEQMADSFFMNKTLRPDDLAAPTTEPAGPLRGPMKALDAAADETTLSDMASITAGMPEGFQPRGSLLNIRA